MQSDRGEHMLENLMAAYRDALRFSASQPEMTRTRDLDKPPKRKGAVKGVRC